eukprot:scaffold29441_cov33-Tisochrysis_lutea.AAC.3
MQSYAHGRSWRKSSTASLSARLGTSCSNCKGRPVIGSVPLPGPRASRCVYGSVARPRWER